MTKAKGAVEKAEREFLVRYLGSSRERMVEAVEGWNEAQWRFRPPGDRWSIADCLEHVSLVERAVLKKIQAAVLESPQALQLRTSDDVILASASIGSPRLTSLVEVRPRRRWSDFEGLMRHFEASRERTLRFAAVTQSDLRAHFFPHPHFGELDCYQWLLFLAAHCERHARQAAEVAADPEFPHISGSASA
jgi:DinB superfamily